MESGVELGTNRAVLDGKKVTEAIKSCVSTTQAPAGLRRFSQPRQDRLQVRASLPYIYSGVYVSANYQIHLR